MSFAKYMQKMQGVYVAPLRRSFGKSQLPLDCNKMSPKFKLKQVKMQCDDGLPVYLKGGARDKILFNVTLATLFTGFIHSIYVVSNLLKY